jgi:hypothetical protein
MRGIRSFLPQARRAVRATSLQLSLAGAFAIGGCAAVVPAGPPPEAGLPVPAAWSPPGLTGTVSPVQQAAYWRSLNDPVLTQLVETAISGNLDLAQAAARLARAREGLAQARAGYLPQITADGGARRDVFDMATRSFRWVPRSIGKPICSAGSDLRYRPRGRIMLRPAMRWMICSGCSPGRSRCR